MFILSSLMSTCELDRFVIQTPYIKVVKSCSAPRGQGGEEERATTFPSEATKRCSLDVCRTGGPLPPPLASPPLPRRLSLKPIDRTRSTRGEERRGEGRPSFFARRGKTHTGELFQTRGPLLWNTRFFFLFNRKRDRERFCSVLTAIGNSYNRN